MELSQLLSQKYKKIVLLRQTGGFAYKFQVTEEINNDIKWYLSYLNRYILFLIIK